METRHSSDWYAVKSFGFENRMKVIRCTFAHGNACAANHKKVLPAEDDDSVRAVTGHLLLTTASYSNMGCNESKNVQLVSNQDRSSKKAVANNAVSPQGQSASTQGPVALQKCGGPITFTHFGDGGRCEPLLMIFAYAGIDFKNEIIKPEQWPEVKPKTKMGTLPIMTVGSEEIVSSLAMLTYLAIEADLEGANPMETTMGNVMVNVIEDCRGPDLFYNRFLVLTQKLDEASHKAKAKEYTEGPLAKMSKFMEANIIGSKWLLSKLTAVDFWLYGTMKALTDAFVPDAWSLMGPKVQQWRKNFEELPAIQNYLNAPPMSMEKPKMKFMYFDVRGRAEPYRMMIAHSGLDCEDVRVTNWETLKPQTPMGYLPVLEVGDTQLTSSLVVLKYLGQECGLSAGEDEAACDTLCYTMEDLRSVVFPSRFLIRQNKMDDETKEAKVKEFEEKLPQFTDVMERHMTGDQWLLKQLSVADFWLYGTLEIIADSLMPDIASRMGPRIEAWKESFEGLPKVKAYLDSRPTDYTL